ncbi:MAG: ferrous iron transport protein B [Anaerolineales bacterium]|nr:ferrous iron transport protein B [Anaerolineales bacterium]
MKIALIGQPNCGKSTLFNQVAGYKAETGNFPGTTVKYTESKVQVLGEKVDLVDLPGTYSLTGTNLAEKEVLRYLASHEVDVILNVVNATQLMQGLELSLELMELGKPMVIGVNMMDEAGRLGYDIDGPALREKLGVPVLPLVARRGRGIQKLFTTALRIGNDGQGSQRIPFQNPSLEEAIADIAQHFDGKIEGWDPEALAIRLLEDGEEMQEQVEKEVPRVVAEIEKKKQAIEKELGKEPLWAFSAERHILAQELTEQVLSKGEERMTWQARLDKAFLHPFWGYVLLLIVLWTFFQVVYKVGITLEDPLLAAFNALSAQLSQWIGSGSLLANVVVGGVQGIAGGAAIVLPYLIPFLVGMGFMEDVGYLPRVAFLMDALMRRLGLHGKAIVPFILGYGCSVPAVMSTRTLEEKRDRFLSATLATMIPCAARVAVIFGLVAYYLGSQVALGIYIYNLVVIAIVGRLLSNRFLKDTPGLILEVPPYRLPSGRTVFHKTWFRAREFILEAWPLLILGSMALELANHYRISDLLNTLLQPVTWVLGLPSAVGMPLIFGVLRKELSLVMLRQALGVMDFSNALSPVQMITFTIFVVFYIPCLATLAALRREFSTRDTVLIAGLSVVIAMVAALIARGFAYLIAPVLSFQI